MKVWTKGNHYEEKWNQSTLLTWVFCVFSRCLSPCLLDWLEPVRLELDLEFELWLPRDTIDLRCWSDQSAVLPAPGYRIAHEGLVSAVEAEKLFVNVTIFRWVNRRNPPKLANLTTRYISNFHYITQHSQKEVWTAYCCYNWTNWISRMFG